MIRHPVKNTRFFGFLLLMFFSAWQLHAQVTDSVVTSGQDTVPAPDSLVVDPAQLFGDSTDSGETNMDSIAIPEEKKERKSKVIPPVEEQTHSPKKAVLWAIIPGMGQVYNKKYWKLPIVYGALGAGIYAINFNQYEYNLFRDAFYTQTDSTVNPADYPFPQYSPRQLIELQNFYRRYRDLSILLTALGYGLQMLDAYVDAHLFYYDISDDLSFRWEPATIRTYNAPVPALGLGITISLK